MGGLISFGVIWDVYYKNILISFFGGEPLLYFNEIIKELIEEARLICKKFNKKLLLNFTTNGLLINKEVLNFLSENNPSFQITLDGNSSVHNKVKKTDEIKDAYTKVVNNIKEIIEYKFNVVVRLNFTISTLPCFIDIISDFKDLHTDEKKYIRFNFQRIWQDKSDLSYEEIASAVHNIEKNFLDSGLNVSPYTSNSFDRCYADNICSVTINYDGNVFKCTARDFEDNNKDGTLREDGTILWNDTFKHRREVTYGGITCRTCKIFPICHGGCSQYKIENIDIFDKCVLNFNENNKMNLINNRVRDILMLQKIYSK